MSTIWLNHELWKHLVYSRLERVWSEFEVLVCIDWGVRPGVTNVGSIDMQRDRRTALPDHPYHIVLDQGPYCSEWSRLWEISAMERNIAFWRCRSSRIGNWPWSYEGFYPGKAVSQWKQRGALLLSLEHGEHTFGGPTGKDSPPVQVLAFLKITEGELEGWGECED